MDCVLCDEAIPAEAVNLNADSPIRILPEWAHSSCADSAAERAAEDRQADPPITEADRHRQAWQQHQEAHR